MAKFYLSNNQDVFGFILTENKRVFPKHNVETIDNTHIVTFAKLSNVSKIYEPKYSIYAVGSFIYKNNIGENALNLIYEDYNKLGVSGLKKSIIGYYNIIISIDGETVVFNDYYGVYDICYSTDGDRFYIGSQLKDVASSIEDRTIDEYSFIQETCQLGAFPGKTIYKHINKLRGNEYLSIKNDKLNVMSIPQQEYLVDYVYSGEDQALFDISKMIKDYSSIITQAYKNIVVFLTGGLDSRLNFAAFSNTETDLRTQYWRSFGVDKEDEVLAKEISEYYGIKFSATDCYDPEDSNGVDWNYQKELFETVGFNNYICNGNPNIIKEIQKYGNNGEFLAFGYFCEAIRLREWAANLKSNTFSLDDYIDKYYINNALNFHNYPHIESYKEYLKLNFVEQLESLGIKDNFDKISLSVFERFRWIMARLCDSRMECLNNTYAFSFSIMSIPQIHQAILSLPDDIIKDGVFQVKLIRLLDNELTSRFSIFSHNRAYKIKKNGHKIRLLTFKNIADSLFLILPVIKPICIQLFRLFKNKRVKIPAVYDHVSKLNTICELGFKFDANHYKQNNINGIIRCRQFLFGIQTINQLSSNRHNDL